MRQVSLLVFLFVGGALWAAPPAITPGGVVNAASYGASVAPGGIAAVFGDFAVSAPVSAAGTPLPGTLAQFSAEFDGGVRVPLFYVSPTQANVQIPWELSGRSQTTLRVTVNGETSAPEAVDLIAYAPGVFGAAITDPAGRRLDAANPAVAGSTVAVIYSTGLGMVRNRPVSGAAAVDALATTVAEPAVMIGGQPAQVLYAGIVPGMVGLYQINARVPARSSTGDAVPVTVSVGGYASNTATMAVRPRWAETADQRAGALVAQMTQEEKLQLVHGVGGPPTNVPPLPRGAGGFVPGIPRLGFPDLYFADGSVGVADSQALSTALPSSIASAAGWDLNAAYRYGQVIGEEMRSHGLNVNLGGNVNLAAAREPRCGRTFETKGEDPILAGKINAAHIRAIQDQHVVGGAKHYALNDQETGRTVADVRIEDRAARETDLLAFEIAVKDANVQSVMCSYNLLNGVYACENPYLLNGVLKGDWGFQGFVMSDWWATHSTVAAALAGLDQEQPNPPYFGDALRQAVARGEVPQARLDDMVRRIVRATIESGLFDDPVQVGALDVAAHRTAAQEAGEQGAVLLKNAGGQLPLNAAAIRSIAVIGPHADVATLTGGGSAQVWPDGGPALNEGRPNPPGWAPVIWAPSSPIAAIQAQAAQAAVRFDDGSDAARAAALAASSDVAIVFPSQWTSEGMDLAAFNFADVIHATAFNQDALISAVAAANQHTIVVSQTGGAHAAPWLGQVSALLAAWYPGQRGAEAIANLLFGDVNPSGKLPITFPASVADLPHPAIAAPPSPGTIFPLDYTEGLEVGYKWYDARGVAPLFPFGFGLSYTTFSISNGRVANRLAEADPRFQVTLDLQNTGAAAGAEVAQVYLGFPAGSGEPPKRLVGWQKVYLEPGALQHVTVEVRVNDSSHPMGYWDSAAHAWRTAPGAYTVWLGNSSASLTAVGTITVE